MKLVIGGSWQGKRRIALRLAAGTDRVTDGVSCTAGELADAHVLDHFHMLVRRAMEEESGVPAPSGVQVCGAGDDAPGGKGKSPIRMEDVERFVHEKAGRDDALIIICDELGCGVVPMDRTDRLWREKTGRLLCALARDASEVYRVVAGIPVRIK